ncbi:MAG TPA: hypothetical protein VKP78_08925 [bacterium]|nr:hypothetical protein [bacterium]
MQFKQTIKIIFITFATTASIFAFSKKPGVTPGDTTISTRQEISQGQDLTIEFDWGKAFNHPTFAVWIEKLDGTFLKTLYATRSMSTGNWPYAKVDAYKWKPETGHRIRPAALPYWFHKRSKISGEPAIPTHEDPLPDAITGATPKTDFKLQTNISEDVPKSFWIFVEINQTWDWNDYWTNNKYPDNADYKSSSQPALVYAVRIDLNKDIEEYYLNPIGHSHYSGKDGNLYTDLSTITSALDIAKTIKVKINR